jgi:hypothetical protein
MTGITDYLAGQGENDTLLHLPVEGRLYRVFSNGSWDQGGRYYGSDYQHVLRSKDRSYLTINGGPTVELDYSAMMARLAYHQQHRLAPEDPYRIYEHPAAREIVKQAVIICLNTFSLKSATLAIQKAIHEEPKLADSFSATGCAEVRKLIEDLVEAQPQLAEMFFQGLGLKLQRLDAAIATTVLQELQGLGIPVLCIHDSFIVPLEHQDELAAVMEEAYHRRVGYDCPIKKACTDRERV